MSIVQKEKDGKTIYVYQEPDAEVIFKKTINLLKILDMYVKKFPELNCNDVSVNIRLLGLTLNRVDKRKDYFVIYHDDTTMNEIKESALLSYWILKFKPFSVVSDDMKVRHKHIAINESFAAFILYSVVYEKNLRENGCRIRISKEYSKKIKYAFRYWDLSKESIILIAETLYEAIDFCTIEG